MMAALATPVRPFAGGVPRHAAAFPSDARECASGKKRPCVGVAPARNSSSCLTKMSSQELLQKRLASELDALRCLLKKAELISQRGACKGGAPTAGKKDRFLASNQRAKPIEEGFSAPLVKKRKISTTPVDQKQKQKQKQKQAPPRMSPEERSQVAGRLSSLSGELPGHIVEFLQKLFGDADSHGEIEINMDTVKDSVLFELKTLLDKFAEESKNKKFAEESKNKMFAEESKKFAEESKNKKVAKESKDDKFAEESKNKKVAEESKYKKVAEESKDAMLAEESKDDKFAKESKDDKVAEESKGKQEEEYADISIGLSRTIETGSKPPRSSSSGDSSDTKVVQQSVEAKKVQDARQRAAPKDAVYMPGLLYRANLRRQLLEMERAVLPDQRIDPRDLQRFGISEYGHPSIMRQLRLVPKVVEA